MIIQTILNIRQNMKLNSLLRSRGKGHNNMRQFFVLWTGQALSLLGTQAVQFALIWWLTVETGSATVLATASLFGLAPQIVAGPFIGSLVDRWNRKIVMLSLIHI